MQCLILAGGLGTRMTSVAGHKPKALLPVGTKTFIDWQLQWLNLLGADDIILALGHGSEEIQKHLSKRKTVGVRFSFDGPKLLGTGGAIRNASPLLAENFLLAYGDSFLFANLKKLMAAHDASGRPLTFSIFKNQDKGDKSNVIFKNGIIEKYDKFKTTPAMEYIDYGMSAMNKKYFIENTPAGASDVADFMSRTCDKHLVTPFVTEKIFHEIGSPEGYKRFQEMMEGIHFDLQALAHSQDLL
jgi:N-acetyl-alpha-D-muramate 1-phosphate uridylyltransferase